jgi:hypothetical protein
LPNLDSGLFQHFQNARALDKHAPDTIRPAGLELTGGDQPFDRTQAYAKEFCRFFA